MKEKRVSLRLIVVMVSIFIMGIFGTFCVNAEEYSNNITEEVCLEIQGGGYIFDDLDQHAPVVKKGTSKRRAARASKIPSSYQTNVTELESKYPTTRNQNPYGTCWAFSSVGLAEFDAIKNNLYNKDVDFSELQLAHYTYNYVMDPLGGTSGDTAKFVIAPGGTNYLNYGGNYLMASRRLAQWIGTTSEENVPYLNAEQVLQNGIDEKYAYSKDLLHLENAYIVSSKNNIEDVKRQIMLHGAGGISYMHQDNALTYNSQLGRHVYYDTDYKGYGHAVMVVGWDDNFSKDNFNGANKPANDGAWLIRNSWGSYVNYFWMSYETASLQDGVWFFDFAASDNYDNNYQLDGGLNVYPANYMKVANVFDVNSKPGVAAETLKAVSLSTTHEANVSYTIQIYTDLKNASDPTSGILWENAVTTGITTYAGIHTIELKNPVVLLPGTKYSVVVTVDKASIDYEQAVSIEFEDGSRFNCAVSSASRNSFYMPDGASRLYPWGWGNFGIKAYTDNEVVVPNEPQPGEHKCDNHWNTEYTIDKQATCKQKGKKSIHCKVCGKVKVGSEVEIPMVSHQWRQEWSGSLNRYVCDNCGKIKQVVSQNITNGTYTIHSALNDQQVIDVSAASRRSGANIQLWETNNCAAQDWVISYVGDGKYTMMATCSGKYLTVAQGGTNPGTNVQQEDFENSNTQMWYIEDAGSGYYYLLSAYNGLCVDVSGGNRTSGANIQVWTSNKMNSQKFSFKQVMYTRTIADGVYTLSMADNTSQRLDISGGSCDGGANVQLWTKNDLAPQEFVVTYVSNGQYKIMASCSGKMLDVSGSGKKNGTNVQQWEDNGALAQRWYIKDAGQGAYYLISACNGLCLDVAGANISAGTNVWTWQMLGSGGQRFVLDAVGAGQIVPDGVYRLVLARNRDMVLDVAGMSTDAGANIQIWSKNGCAAQEFYFKYKGNGVYSIMASCSGKMLDVAGIGQSVGTNIWQWENNHLSCQEWYVKRQGNGTYSLISKCNGLYLDVQGGNLNVGTNVWCWYGLASDAQKFVFEPVSDARTIDDGYYTISSALNQNLMLDVSAGNPNNGANIQLWTRNNMNPQRFYVYYLGSGMYEIQTFSGRRVDVSGAGSTPGTNVMQWDSNGGNQQKWFIRPVGDGTYNVISVHNGLYLDVAGNVGYEGNNVHMWNGNGVLGQRFIFNVN